MKLILQHVVQFSFLPKEFLSNPAFYSFFPCTVGQMYSKRKAHSSACATVSCFEESTGSVTVWLLFSYTHPGLNNSL
jgi:hypothetical protein